MKGQMPFRDYERLEKQFQEFKVAWPPAGWRDDVTTRRFYFSLAPAVPTHQKMLVAIAHQAASVRWDKPAYIPSPANWLGQRKWNEDPAGYPPAAKLDLCESCHRPARTCLCFYAPSKAAQA